MCVRASVWVCVDRVRAEEVTDKLKLSGLAFKGYFSVHTLMDEADKAQWTTSSYYTYQGM